jgi:transcription termination/antitermination protein NusA
MGIQIDTDTFRIMSLFEKMTKVYPMDCLINDTTIYFLIKDKIGLAVGKGGSTVKEVSKKLGKQVKLFEYSEDPKTFIKNMIPSAEEIKIEPNSIEIVVPDKDKSAIIGREGRNIKAIREFSRRHLKVENLRLK